MASFSLNRRLFNAFLHSQKRCVLKCASTQYFINQNCCFTSNIKQIKDTPVRKAFSGYFPRHNYLFNNQLLHSQTISIGKYGTTSENEKPTLYQRFKTMYRDYWYVLLPVHMITSATWFGGFYYVASSGIDIVGLLESMKVSETILDRLRNGHATSGYLAVAFALYKIATPLRYTVTLGGTTLSINYLRKWGYIKPVPSREKLKEIYEGKKEQLKEKGQNLKDNVVQSLKHSTSKKNPPSK